MKSLTPIHKALEEAELHGQLIPCLLSLENRVRRLECGPILCKLHNAGKISLVSDENLAAIEALEHNQFWSIFHSLEQAISELNCSFSDLLKFVQILVDKAGSDGIAGMPNMSLVKWCKANPEEAKKIVLEAKSLNKICLSHCAFAIQGLESPELAFELLAHSDKAVVVVGLRSLGRLEIDDITLSKQIIDECCKAIGCGVNRDLRYSAIETAFKTWSRIGLGQPYRQRELLENIINEMDSEELAQLSNFLAYHQKGLVAESINQILEALSGDVSNPLVIINRLNQAINYKDERWDLKKVINVIAVQIPKLDKPIEPNLLYKFCEWIWESRDYTSQLFSSWLVSGDYSLCEFLVNMIGEGRDKNVQVEINKHDLPETLEDQIFMARKCVGFLLLHEVTAASILLSLVKNGKKVAQQTAEDLLFEPLLLCYGGELRRFIETQIGNPSKRISDCVQRLIKRHDAYLEGLKTNELVELFPTIEQRRAVAVKDWERNKTIQKQAHERSIFSQMVSHQTLLYGKKSFSIIHGQGGTKIPSITPLSEFTYSTEFPRLSVVDPIGFDQMLTIFRIERKVSP